jgi:hypothetical protein
MKVMLLLSSILLLGLLTGCGGSSSGDSDGNNVAAVSLNDMDLTGTWQRHDEWKIFNIATGDYLYSSHSYSRVYIEDSVQGVRERFCGSQFDDSAPYGRKSDSQYISSYGWEYQHLGGVVLGYVGPLQTEYFFPPHQPVLESKPIGTLTKLSDEDLGAEGVLTLNQPFAFQNAIGACVRTEFETYKPDRTLTLFGEYDAKRVSFGFVYAPGLSPQEYAYSFHGPYLDIIYMAVDVDETQLEPYFGVDGFGSGKSGLLRVLEFDRDRVSLEFELKDENDNVVAGVAEMDARWLEFGE